MDGPGAGLRFIGQAQALQALQAADQQQALALQPRLVEPFDMHQAIVAQLALERAIQARPPLLLHLALQGLLDRSEEHTSELQSLMRISYAVFCLKKKKTNKHKQH